MKHLLVILFILSMGESSSWAKMISHGVESISAELEYVLVEASIACATKYHPQTEGEENPELFYMNKSEYSEIRSLEKQGYTVLRKTQSGRFCSQTQGEMIHVSVGLFDPHSEIIERIHNLNASVKDTLILIKNEKLMTDIQQKRNAIVESLREK